MLNKSRILTGALALYAVISMVVVFSTAGWGEEVVRLEGPSFIESQKLPPLARMDSENAAVCVEPLQVMKRIQLLKLTDYDLIYPSQNYDLLCQAFEGFGEGEKEEAAFEGERASELNAFLAENAGRRVTVQAREIAVDETIRVPDGTRLAGRQTRLVGDLDVAISLDQVKDVVISGFVLDGGFGYGVYAVGGECLGVIDCAFADLRHKPVVFMGDCKGVLVRGNAMTGNLEGGLYFNGDTQNVLIEGNEITDNFGTSNWMAGIVLTGIDVADVGNVYASFREDLHFPAEQRLDSMLKAPHNVIVRNNRVCRNNSSGVYCDGPYKVFILENRIEGNDKEGMCLDYGTVAAYVAENDILGNGNRARQTDDDLAMDFVLDLGRLEDGSAVAKLPGISIDNSAYNIVYNNRVSRNYGSGVKMVRTGVRNVVTTNLITDNNRSPSATHFFFGIELGGAVPDAPAENLDFVPAYENIICRNMITGTHYAGIYLSEGSFINDLFDNSIYDVTNWSIESETDRYNSCLNNVSNVQSRGIALSSTLAVPVAGMIVD